MNDANDAFDSFYVRDSNHRLKMLIDYSTIGRIIDGWPNAFNDTWYIYISLIKNK